MSGLTPTAKIALASGQSTSYEGIQIKIETDGRLAINGRTDEHCLECSRGVGGSCRVVVLLRPGEVWIFTGSTVGRDMVNRQMILQQYGLA